MSAIKVGVRLRPINEARKEKWAPGFDIHGRRLTLGAKTYDPDVTLSTTSTQDDVFAHAVPILEAVKDGSNGTILVYGQTGTGKTHTMIGGEGNYDGVAIKSIAYLLDYVRDQTRCGRPTALLMSVLEIYNERITDMLSDEGDNEVTLLNGFPRSTTQKTLSSLEQAVDTVKTALHARHVSETAMNERSSRSHVIFMLDLAEQREDGRAEVSHLFLVDLAGSESVKKSEASGKAVREAGMINKSLLALKTVIMQLSTNQDPATRGHVPYRDSRLTELLQDSIGGTARTMFIACISPNGRDVDETKSTLDYATKARSIRNVSNTARDKLQVRCRGLEVELLKYKNKLDRTAAEKGGYWISKEEHERNIADADELRTLRETVSELQADAKEAKAASGLVKGEIELLKHWLDEKDKDVDRHKQIMAANIQKMQQAAYDLELQVAKRAKAARGAVAGDHDAMRCQIDDVMQHLDSEELALASVHELDAMWNRINQRHADTIAALQAIPLTLESEIMECQKRQAQAIRDAMAAAVKSVTESSTTIDLALSSANKEFASDFELAKSSAATAAATKDLSEREAATTLARATARHARELVAALPTPEPSAETTQALSDVASVFDGSMKQIVCTGISGLSSFSMPPESARPTVPLPSAAAPAVALPNPPPAAADDDVADADSQVSAAMPSRPAASRRRGSIPLGSRLPSADNSQMKRSRSRATDSNLENGRHRRQHPSLPKPPPQ